MTVLLAPTTPPCTTPRGCSLLELAARIGVSPRRLLPLLLDEEQRGHVELVGGEWRATPALLERHGEALGRVAP